MNQSISLPLRLSRKISFAHAAAFLITLPFDFFYNELVLLSFLLHTLIHTSPGAWRKLANKNGWIITSFTCWAGWHSATVLIKPKEYAFSPGNRHFLFFRCWLYSAISIGRLRGYPCCGSSLLPAHSLCCICIWMPCTPYIILNCRFLPCSAWHS